MAPAGRGGGRSGDVTVRAPSDLPQTVGRNGAGRRSHQGVVGDGVHGVSVEAEGDRAAGESESDLVTAAVEADEPVVMDLAVDLDRFAGGEDRRAAAGLGRAAGAGSGPAGRSP